MNKLRESSRPRAVEGRRLCEAFIPAVTDEDLIRSSEPSRPVAVEGRRLRDLSFSDDNLSLAGILAVDAEAHLTPDEVEGEATGSSDGAKIPAHFTRPS